MSLEEISGSFQSMTNARIDPSLMISADSFLFFFFCSALRAVSVLDYPHEGTGDKRRRNRDNECHHSPRGDGDAAGCRYVSRPNRKFQSESADFCYNRISPQAKRRERKICVSPFYHYYLIICHNYLVP